MHGLSKPAFISWRAIVGDGVLLRGSEAAISQAGEGFPVTPRRRAAQQPLSLS